MKQTIATISRLDAPPCRRPACPLPSRSAGAATAPRGRDQATGDEQRSERARRRRVAAEGRPEQEGDRVAQGARAARSGVQGPAGPGRDLPGPQGPNRVTRAPLGPTGTPALRAAGERRGSQGIRRPGRLVRSARGREQDRHARRSSALSSATSAMNTSATIGADGLGLITYYDQDERRPEGRPLQRRRLHECDQEHARQRRQRRPPELLVGGDRRRRARADQLPRLHERHTSRSPTATTSPARAQP